MLKYTQFKEYRKAGTKIKGLDRVNKIIKENRRLQHNLIIIMLNVRGLNHSKID